MNKALRSGLLIITVACLCLGVLACKGGKTPIVGDIEGPVEVNEYSKTAYSIGPNIGTDVECFWTVDPPSAGQLDPPDLPETTFTANQVTSDIEVEFRVVISAAEFDPVIKTKRVKIIELV